MIACLCVSGFLLVGSFSYIVYVRTKKRNQNTTSTEKDKNQSVETTSTASAYDSGELPDLDVLLNVPMHVAAEPPPPTRVVKPGTYEIKLADTGEAIQAAEVMIILRDVDEGRLIVQLGDQSYSNLSNFPDGKNRFMKVMKELARIVTPKPTSAAPAPAPETSTPAKPEAPTGLAARLADNKNEQPPTVGELLSTPNEPKKPVTSAPPPPLADGSMPGDLPKFKLDEAPLAPRRGPGFMRMSKDQEREMKKPVPELNIAQAIQEYLQYKLRHTPEYSGRSINVSPAAGGGVKIEVDGKFYDAVGDIDDVEVRDFMAKTIEEWQSRQ
ncbi:MAG: hypothetical protein U0694_09725 [Anaerolineae bacterium]